jgi:hypothetical protein
LHITIIFPCFNTYRHCCSEQQNGDDGGGGDDDDGDNNSIQFLFICVPTQQPKGQLQSEY